jgi:hypothetical protein
MGAPLGFIDEVDSTSAHSSDLRRAAMLRHLTDLYLVGGESYSEDELAVIDDVFMRLVSTIEESSRAAGDPACPAGQGPATSCPTARLRRRD